MGGLELNDIQGDILRGYRAVSGAYLFFEVADAAGGRALLGELAGEVQNAAPWKGRGPAAAVNVAITYDGLRAVGVREEVLRSLPPMFTGPMRKRAVEMLDDKGLSAPEHWDEGIGTERSHILVTIKALAGAGDEQSSTAKADEVLARAQAHGVRLLWQQDACWNPTRREHFGWADGLGQPSIEGTPWPSKPGQGVPLKNGGWRDLKAGEFIHGYPDEDGDVVAGPAAGLLRNGTYMVYRKLYQDIVGFREQLYEDAQKYGATLAHDPPLSPDHLYELLGAKVVGRWRDGHAIELVPEHPNPLKLGDEAVEQPSNDFRYLPQDANGFTCPKGAHIRRCNPRDALGWDGQMSMRHRIIRRGMPYGPYLEFEPGQQDDGVDRGLVFIAFNAAIDRQFEIIQRQWLDDGNVFGLGNDKDYLLGDRGITDDGKPAEPGPDGRVSTGRVMIQGSPPHFVEARPPVVRTKACEYLLTPGIAALRALAAGRV